VIFAASHAYRVGLEYAIVAVTCFFSLRPELSRRDLVLVCESAEDLSSADPVLGEVDLRRPGAGLGRGELAKGAVRPVGLEYAIVAVTCFFSQQGGAVRRRSGTRA
jgi:hypothetical protein